MKKLFFNTISVFSLFLIPTLTQAQELSIGLTNYSKNTVEFSTAVDPGFIPEVKPNTSYVLPCDFMAGCIDPDNSCPIVINDGTDSVLIDNMPKGTVIEYYGPNNYRVRSGQQVFCD